VGVANFFLGQSIGVDETNTFQLKICLAMISAVCTVVPSESKNQRNQSENIVTQFTQLVSKMSKLPICKHVFAGNLIVSMNTCSFQQRIGALVKYFDAKAYFKSGW